MISRLRVPFGHRISGDGGIDRLGLSILIAMVGALPFGIHEALPAFNDFRLLAAAIGVGISSSVIPYVTDQLAMARQPSGRPKHPNAIYPRSEAQP